MFFAALIIADLDYKKFVQKLKRRRQNRYLKHLRDNSNAFLLDDVKFRQTYRMPIPVVMYIISLIEDQLVGKTKKRIPPHLQVLAALRFYAQGSHQLSVADDYKHPMAQPSVSRCIKAVTNALVNISPIFIVLPKTREEREAIADGFKNTIRIPGIQGLVDCMVTKIIKPATFEEQFYHHKHQHSLNTQMICDANYIIRNIRITPGSNNDKSAWKHSEVKCYLQNLRAQEQKPFYFIGDSGYDYSPLVLRPILNVAQGTPEDDYNEEIVKTRCKIEQTFGILTGVFRCIKRQRTLYYRPEKAGKIIIACAVLHNIRRQFGLLDDGLLDDTEENDDNDGFVNDEDISEYEAGIEELQNILHKYYI